MSLSVAFTVLFAICVLDTIFILVWLMKGFTSWRLEPNNRKIAGLGGAVGLVALQWVAVVVLTDPGYWKPRAENAIGLAYDDLRPVDNNWADAKIMTRMHDYMRPCVVDGFSSDQTRLSANLLWAMPVSSNTVKKELSEEIGVLEGLCWMGLEPQIKRMTPDSGQTAGITQKLWARWKSDKKNSEPMAPREVMLLELFFEMKAAAANPTQEQAVQYEQTGVPLLLKKPEKPEDALRSAPEQKP